MNLVNCHRNRMAQKSTARFKALKRQQHGYCLGNYLQAPDIRAMEQAAFQGGICITEYHMVQKPHGIIRA